MLWFFCLVTIDSMPWHFSLLVGDASKVGVLILRSNGYHGAFGKPESKLEFPKLQIISLWITLQVSYYMSTFKVGPPWKLPTWHLKRIMFIWLHIWGQHQEISHGALILVTSWKLPTRASRHYMKRSKIIF